MRLKFRRQHAIGPYITDFCCPEAKLVIEVDGPIHETQTEQDAFRDKELAALGYQVLRFKESDLLLDTAKVMARIVEFIQQLGSPESSPLHSMERGRG